MSKYHDLCECGHPVGDHHGTMTNWNGKVTSETACLNGTRFITAGSWGERVGGDRCKAWNPPKKTLRERLFR